MTTPNDWNEARQRELVRLLDENGDRLRAVDPSWPSERQRSTRERLHAERAPLLDEAERPLVAALAAAGFPVESVYYLNRRECDYDAAFPLLLNHLDRTYPPIIRGGIARAFACRSAAPYWDELVARLRREPKNIPGKAIGAAMELAVAIPVACPEARLPELMDLLRDRSLGPDRLLFIRRLWRARKGAFRPAILELADEPDLHKEIAAKVAGKGRRD